MYTLIKGPTGVETLTFLSQRDVYIHKKSKSKLPLRVYIVDAECKIVTDVNLDYDLTFRSEKYKEVFDGIIETSSSAIFYGPHGAGKTNFTRAVAKDALSYGKSTFFVNLRNVDQIMELVGCVNEPAIFVLEEFDKLFPKNYDDDKDKQKFLLSLFSRDHTRIKHSFIINVNELSKLSKFIKSRPGRFRYSINFPALTSAEIIKYLDDSEVFDAIVRKYIYATHIFIGGMTADVLTKIVDEIKVFPNDNIRKILNRLNVHDVFSTNDIYNRFNPYCIFLDDPEKVEHKLDLTTGNTAGGDRIYFSMPRAIKKSSKEKKLEDDVFGGSSYDDERGARTVVVTSKDIIDVTPEYIEFSAKSINAIIRLELVNYAHKSMMTQLNLIEGDK